MQKRSQRLLLMLLPLLPMQLGCSASRWHRFDPWNPASDESPIVCLYQESIGMLYHPEPTLIHFALWKDGTTIVYDRRSETHRMGLLSADLRDELEKLLLRTAQASDSTPTSQGYTTAGNLYHVTFRQRESDYSGWTYKFEVEGNPATGLRSSSEWGERYAKVVKQLFTITKEVEQTFEIFESSCEGFRGFYVSDQNSTVLNWAIASNLAAMTRRK